ncbi:MAG: hypothetical protein CSB48_07145 [Proteobacteria bacterium]|nr:MAG: hypothetical protein CSB48_07145 [Pseudomonadota bacterium]PIE40156.1 MAG: hypothetical protein CSA51_01960 [Gammaproteobacteria bacterium]
MNRPIIVLVFLATLFAGCSSREIQGNLAGSTAQRLLSHSIDDLIAGLPESEFSRLSGKTVYVNPHFLYDSGVKKYADQRLVFELENKYKATVVTDLAEADEVLTVFYTSLATDIDNFGIAIPVSYVPGTGDGTRLNLLTLEKFHGIAEMYYYLGKQGRQHRGKTMQAVVKTDALGLPFITIPLSNIDRHEQPLF